MEKEGDQQTGGEPKNPMTKEAASRIQSSEAKKHGGEVKKGSWAARAQSAADKNENKDKQGGQQTGEAPKNLMTKEAASRIQSSEAKEQGGGVEAATFPARGQAAADKHENKSF